MHPFFQRYVLLLMCRNIRNEALLIIFVRLMAEHNRVGNNFLVPLVRIHLNSIYEITSDGVRLYSDPSLIRLPLLYYEVIFRGAEVLYPNLINLLMVFAIVKIARGLLKLL